MIIIDRQANKKSINDWKWLFSLLTYHDAPLFPYVNHTSSWKTDAPIQRMDTA